MGNPNFVPRQNPCPLKYQHTIAQVITLPTLINRRAVAVGCQQYLCCFIGVIVGLTTVYILYSFFHINDYCREWIKPSWCVPANNTPVVAGWQAIWCVDRKSSCHPSSRRLLTCSLLLFNEYSSIEWTRLHTIVLLSYLSLTVFQILLFINNMINFRKSVFS